MRFLRSLATLLPCLGLFLVCGVDAPTGPDMGWGRGGKPKQCREPWTVTVTPEAVNLVVPAVGGLTASVVRCGVSVQNTIITWTVRNTAVAAAITATTPTVTVSSVAAGTTYVHATSDGGGADSALVTVVDQDPPSPQIVDGCPTSGYTRLVNVTNTTTLNSALNTALPGDQIRLAAGNYNYTSSGGRQVNQSGTSESRITICGPRTAIINAYVWVRASFVDIRGLRIQGNSPQPMVWGIYQTVGGNNRYMSLEVDHQSQEGINLHDGPSYNNVVSNNYIHDCGQVRLDRGEGIYIGNGDDPTQIVDSTWIHHNLIESCAGEGIEIKCCTKAAIIEFNTIINAGHGRVNGGDIPIQVRGTDNIIRDNTIQTSPRYSIENFADVVTGGQRNRYERNTASGAGNNLMFSFGTNAGSSLAGNVVCTNNVAIAPMTLNAGSRLQAC